MKPFLKIAFLAVLLPVWALAQAAPGVGASGVSATGVTPASGGGVTSIVAGRGVAVSGATGDVTVKTQPSVTTIVSNATPTVNTDTSDFVTITALAVDITSMTTNISGTPTNGQKLAYRIKDDGSNRAITWGASFATRVATLPTTTTAGKVLGIVFWYNTVTSTWDCMAAGVES